MSDATSSTSAATDVSEFITDLDGGIFDRKLSIALSQCAAAAMDNDKQAEVTIKLTFKKIPGTAQVHCTHVLKYTKPTMDGKASEEEKRTTPLFVGKYGKLTLGHENQLTFLAKQGAVS